MKKQILMIAVALSTLSVAANAQVKKDDGKVKKQATPVATRRTKSTASKAANVTGVQTAKPKMEKRTDK